MTAAESSPAAGVPRLLLVDDDVTFCQVLSDALEKRGFAVRTAHDATEALHSAERDPPDYAVLDLRMPGASGLELIPRLKRLNEPIKIVVLTGYASIATAVEAVKLGAVHYLTKPADADDIVAIFHGARGDPATPVAQRPLSVERLEWEHINKVLMDCKGNVSAAARALGMHRRTLQRKLNKRPVRR
ncbi:MAG: response regulator transcription factor [Gammaproteobacteria bacterium]|nr:response regulator transcription factor [Gammaproteobacteria bacterium]